jgi:hypothetical protein
MEKTMVDHLEGTSELAILNSSGIMCTWTKQSRLVKQTKENQMLNFIKSVLLVNKVKKATATRFVTAYSKHGRINGIIVKRGIIKSVIRVPYRGDVTVYNTNIGFIRHDKVTSFK